MSVFDILVVGGSGFIGTRLIRRLLASGHRVRIFDKHESALHPAICTIGDVRDERALRDACRDAQVIYNLAAEHRDDVRPASLYDEVNVGGAENVVAAAEDCGVGTIVFTSSVAVYPFSETPLDESADPAPFNDYGRTKLQAEGVQRRWQERGEGRSLVVLRLTVVFGEGNRANVYNLIHQIERGHFVMMGDGRNRKSIAYVENVAGALQFALPLGAGYHLFNYTDQPDYDMASLVREIRGTLGLRPDPLLRLPLGIGLFLGTVFDVASRVSGQTFPMSTIRVRKFSANTQFLSDMIREKGFSPDVDLKHALRHTIEVEFPRKKVSSARLG